MSNYSKNKLLCLLPFFMMSTPTFPTNRMLEERECFCKKCGKKFVPTEEDKTLDMGTASNE